MVGAAGIRECQRLRGWIVVGVQPCAKVRTRGFISLHVDASYFSRAVVVVEVHRQLLKSFLLLDRSAAPHHRTQEIAILLGKVLCDVCPRAKKALLLAAPQSDADRPAGYQTQLLNDPDRLEAHGRSGRVVCSTRSCVPRVKMRTDHDD